MIGDFLLVKLVLRMKSFRMERAKDAMYYDLDYYSDGKITDAEREYISQSIKLVLQEYDEARKKLNNYDDIWSSMEEAE